MALEKLTTLPWFYQFLILVAVASLLVVGVEYAYFRDLTAGIDSQHAQLAAIKSELANMREVEQRYRDFQQANDRLERQLAEMRSALPVDREGDGLIRQFQEIATRANIQVLRLMAKPVAKREASGSAAPADKKSEIQSQLYSELPFTLELSGSYTGMGMFFERVAHMARIVNISDLDMAGISNTNKVHLKVKPNKGLGDTVVATCTATTYFQSEP